MTKSPPEELDEDVGRWEKDTKAATEVREKEAADYMATSLDFGESLDALDGAILVLKKKSGNIAQAQEALLQVKALPLVPEASKRALVAFLQQGQPAVEEMPDSQLFNEVGHALGASSFVGNPRCVDISDSFVFCRHLLGDIALNLAGFDLVWPDLDNVFAVLVELGLISASVWLAPAEFGRFRPSSV